METLKATATALLPLSVRAYSRPLFDRSLSGTAKPRAPICRIRNQTSRSCRRGASSRAAAHISEAVIGFRSARATAARCFPRFNQSL